MQTHSDSFQRYGQHEIQIDVLLLLFWSNAYLKKIAFNGQSPVEESRRTHES